MIEYAGRNTHGEAGSATVEITPSSGFWPKRGSLVSVMVRKTAGSAAKIAWAIYSEDPASLPVGTELSEYLLASGLDAGGNDRRAVCNNDPKIPDAFVQFTDGVKWQPKSATAIGKLWAQIQYDAGSDNQGLVVLMAAPNPDHRLAQPPL